MNEKHIRNFSIIAHIDHGKSTLSDRIIELTHGLEKREMKDQVLDSMDIERERGITIKLNSISLNYTDKRTNKKYVFNLIDTPGHVDFNYEVSRSLAACEGALLVIDATQGVQAQTIANTYLALANNLNIITVVNKIDLPSADINNTLKQIKDVIEINNHVNLISAKTGEGVDKLLESIVDYIPPPEGDSNAKLQALIFDSYYDSYRGVICFIRIKNGSIHVGQHIKMMANNKDFIITKIGIKTPKFKNVDVLNCGDVGWISANIKTAKDIEVGDTITDFNNPCLHPLPGYKKVLPMVYCGMYPVDNSKYAELKDAMMKIVLSDSSLTYKYETSAALGFGVRCGFLGLLHMDVIRERISREYNIDLILTAPSVEYNVLKTNGETIKINNPSELPDPTFIKEIREPFVKLEIITPEEYLGGLMKLAQKHHGIYQSLDVVEGNQRKLVYNIPLNEIIYNFFNSLKVVSHGYASMNYDLLDYQKSNLVKVDILLNGKKVDPLSMILHKQDAHIRAKTICERLKKFIPRQQFEIPIQAAIGGKIIARETISAIYKNVLAKCYGGDVSRKKKLLEQQKEGKKKLKNIGNVSIEHDTFIKILNNDE
ncbi:MAG: elongation factor 4 [Mycoplasma sp.]|nr:elongation factor 4 [Mycoplasma sp.]